jgi:hypothetical protein
MTGARSQNGKKGDNIYILNGIMLVKGPPEINNTIAIKRGRGQM